MISDDMNSLRGILARRADQCDGQIFLSADQSATVLALIDSLIGQQRAQEQLIYGGNWPLPEGVVVLDTVRRHRQPRCVAVPMGGPAA